MENINITCYKCGKEKIFKSIASIWVNGWVPVTKDQYLCDHCCQTEYTDINGEIDINSITKQNPHHIDKKEWREP